jgi:pSer/pThr/pTyr-binding forkhead associated (FHA) protein
MPSIILGRERFALPIGETRVGGTGDDALPFAALRALPTVAVLFLTPSERVSLWPAADGAGVVMVNGGPLGSEPVPVTHGTRIDVAGVQLVFRDSRETGATGETVTLPREQYGLASDDDADVPTPDMSPDGARLTRRGTGATVDIPDSGLVIGRDADSDLVTAGVEVSRRHAVLRRSDRGYVLTDVSRNGTFVNGRRIKGSRVLRVGDVVRIGQEELQFHAGRATRDSAATPTAQTAQSQAEPPTADQPGDVGIWRRLARRWRA